MFEKNESLPSSMKWLKITTYALAALTLGLGGFLAYSIYLNRGDLDKIATSSSVSAISSETKGEKVIDAGVTWQSPQPLGDLGLFEKAGENSSYADTAYYKVGEITSGNEIILAKVKLGLSQPPQIHRFIGKDGKYRLLVNNSADLRSEIYTLSDGVGVERSYFFKSLLADPVIEGPTMLLVSSKKYEFDEQNPEGRSAQKVDDTKWGEMYFETVDNALFKSPGGELTPEDTMIKPARYYILLNDSSKLSYEPIPKFISDRGDFNLEYSLSEASQQIFQRAEPAHCNLNNFYFGRIEYPVEKSFRVEVGRSQDKSVYTLSSVDHKLMQYLYDFYSAGRGDDKVSMIEFAATVGFVYWDDDFGNSILFINSRFVPLKNCNDEGQ